MSATILKVNRMGIVLVLMKAFFVTQSSSWALPSQQFLETFTLKFQVEGIRVALPYGNSNRRSVLGLMKHMRYLQDVEKMDKNAYYWIPFQ